MARGGARKGAGRKPGSANVKTREIADKAAAEGITPLEVMLANMRWAWDKVEEFRRQFTAVPVDTKTMDEFVSYRRMAQESAKDAAPYMHPKLANLEHSGKGGGPIGVELIDPILRRSHS